ITGQITVTAPEPQMVVNPLQPIVQVLAGGTASQTITVSNQGPGSLLTGIKLSLVSRSAGTPYPWVSLSASTNGTLATNCLGTFDVTVAPPPGTVPTAYQDTAI